MAERRAMVEWDMFRTEVLRAQGWNLLRVWSPHVVRDPLAVAEAIAKEEARELAKEQSTPHEPPAKRPDPLPTARLLN